MSIQRPRLAPRRSLSSTLLAASAFLVSACAGAPSAPDSDGSGVYLRAAGGLGFLADGDLDRQAGGGSPGVAGDADYDSGFLSTFAVGYRIDPRWSTELELAYRSNDIDGVREASGGATIAESGDFASLSFMLNGRYHFDTGESPVQPYVGLGIGVVEEIDVDLDPLGGGGTERSFSDSGLGLQAMLGADYALGSGWSLNAEGRYFTALDFSLGAEGGGGGTFEGDYDHFGLLFGLGYSF